jgi:hypothetical protein
MREIGGLEEAYSRFSFFVDMYIEGVGVLLIPRRGRRVAINWPLLLWEDGQNTEQRCCNAQTRTGAIFHST